MWIRIARDFPIGIVDKPLISYTHHANSLTAGQTWARYKSNRAIHKRYIRQERSFLKRLQLLLAAQSMNAYYTAAARLDHDLRHEETFLLALVAAVLDPFYKTRYKAGVLFRSAFGRPAFERAKKIFK